MPDDLGFASATMISDRVDEFQQQQQQQSSDTILMEEEESFEEDIGKFLSDTNHYMEQASIEALITADQTTTVLDKEPLFRQSSSSSSSSSFLSVPQWTRMESATDSEVSEYNVCQTVEPIAATSRRNSKSPMRKLKQVMKVTTTLNTTSSSPLTTATTTTTKTMEPRPLQDIFHQCASLTLPLHDLSKY